MNKRKRKEAGFTLIEMLIVLAIIGILITLTLPVYNKTVARAQGEGCDAIKHSIRTQMEAYYLDHTNQYPSGDPIAELVTAGYLKEKPACPSGGGYSVTITDGNPEVKCSKHVSVPSS